jgi:MGT family glycosyltransferase
VKIPAVQICANLPLRRDLAVPPLTSDHIPTGTALSRLRIRLHWWSIHFGSGLLGARKLRAQVREFFRQHPDAVPGDFHAHLQLGPNLRIPTLVTCAPEFDFPRDSSEGLHYLGPCVDLSRPEAPLPAELPSGDAPLLVCSLGSHGDRVREHRAFFQAVIDAVARRPQWRLLMAVGSHLGAASFGTPPPNVVVVDKLPQLSALKRASLMITHGGLSSVKECICLGVPMLVYPLVYDQPGNAARVVHHGLGLRGNVRQASAEKIGAQIDEVAGNPAYRDRVRALQRVFLEADEAGRGAETVERLLRR